MLESKSLKVSCNVLGLEAFLTFVEIYSISAETIISDAFSYSENV
jgi:hypothetical protein